MTNLDRPPLVKVPDLPFAFDRVTGRAHDIAHCSLIIVRFRMLVLVTVYLDAARSPDT